MELNGKQPSLHVLFEALIGGSLRFQSYFITFVHATRLR